MDLRKMTNGLSSFWSPLMPATEKEREAERVAPLSHRSTLAEAMKYVLNGFEGKNALGLCYRMSAIGNVSNSGLQLERVGAFNRPLTGRCTDWRISQTVGH